MVQLDQRSDVSTGELHDNNNQGRAIRHKQRSECIQTSSTCSARNRSAPARRGPSMSKNRGVVYTKPGEVQVQDIADPKFENPQGRKIEHGVILKVVSTNICGSDQHMVRGRTSAPAGMVLGHEITGEVIEKGSDVEMIEVGDLVSVPFNVACGRCRTCRETNTGVCLTVNPGRAGGAYGYVDMGGWIGGQAPFVMGLSPAVTLLKLSGKAKARSR